MPDRPRAGTRPSARQGDTYTASAAPRRPKGSRLLRRLRRLALLTVVAALVAGGWWLYQSPLLDIQEVTVEGTRILDAEELAAISGLRGSSVVLPDTGGARQRLEAVPMVKSVNFERAWPRGMRVIVTERRPWGFWEAGNRRYIVDEDGFVLERVLPDEGAPAIHHVGATSALEAGDQVDSDVVSVTGRLADVAIARLGLNLVAMEYRDQDGVTAVFEGDLRVTFGDGRYLDYKMAALNALLERTQQQGVEVSTVDLRFGERIVFQ